MGAISTIVHPSGSKALVFYNTAENTVALEIRDTVVTKDDNDDDLKTDSVAATYEDSDANVTGLVTNPTSLVSLYLDASDTYLVGVYGIIQEDTTTKVAYGRLCLLSPTLMPIGDGSEKVDVKYGRLAGSQKPNTKNAGRLYYRSTTATSKISRYDLDDKKSEDVDGADDPGDSTYLAAYYDTDKNYHHVLYQKQTSSEQKKIFDFQDGTTTDLADVGVKNAHYPAGIAAVYVGSKSQAYLYYVAEIDSSYHLYRAIKGSSSWSHSKVDTDSDPNGTTQVAATVITGKKKNYVVFTNDSGNLETVQDDW